MHLVLLGTTSHVCISNCSLLQSALSIGINRTLCATTSFRMTGPIVNFSHAWRSAAVGRAILAAAETTYLFMPCKESSMGFPQTLGDGTKRSGDRVIVSVLCCEAHRPYAHWRAIVVGGREPVVAGHA